MAGNLNTTLQRTFEISGLARCVAIELTAISQKSAANLVCSGAHLVELVLSMLWAKQRSFHTLLGVLPEAMLDHKVLRGGEYLVSWVNHRLEALV